jgi:Cu(I)/Ag(I) efflux system membrane fusion protein/cobalt-zinc-cadmium efflux system membrane fusion protein
MNSREKKILLAGAALGMMLAAVLMGAYAFQGSHRQETMTSRKTPTSAPAQEANAGESAGATATEQAGATVQLTLEEMGAAGVQTVEVTRGRLKTDVDAFGRVEQPEAQLASIPARVGGRIEKLYVQYTGQEVRRGQPVAEIYSPEVAASAEEYRLALDNRERMKGSSDQEAQAGAEQLVEASRRKLELWGISEKQIQRAAVTTAGNPHPVSANPAETRVGHPPTTIPTITMYSPASGSVVERKVTQGQYVNAGDTLFTVADLSTVWVKADVYESQLPEVKAGQAVEITSEAMPSNQTIHGQVELIEPTANPQTRTVPVHVHVSNPGMRLRPGMFVRTKFISKGERDTLLVPRSAVLDTGTRKMLYVAKADGVFEARDIEVGAPSQDAYPVMKGVKEGEKVVTSGNFMIDSQTRLSGGMTGLFGGSKEYGSQKQNGAARAEQGPVSANVKITFAVEPDPPKGAAENTFRVTVVDANGRPVEGAQVKVTLVMPAMPSMSMPEMRSSFELPWIAGQNLYRGRGTISTPGPWNVTVEVSKDGKLIGSYRTRVSATT